MKQIRTISIAISAALLAALAAGCGDDGPVGPTKSARLGPLAQFSIESNSDLVVNNGAGGVDNTQEAMDDSLQGAPTNYAYLTQSAAAERYPTDPDGLPDDGFFPASSFHPDVQLAYRNNRNGHNARRIMTNGEAYEISTGSERFSEIHLFMAAGQGSVNIQLRLNYADVDVVLGSAVPDWFSDPTETANLYYLINGMDRMKRDGSTLENRDDAAVFGFRVLADTTRALESVTILRTNNNSANSVLALLGATGVRSFSNDPPAKAPGKSN
jgi:hypothetical protein